MTTNHTTLTHKVNKLTPIRQWAIIVTLLFSSFLFGCKKDKEDVSPQERLPFLGKYEVVDKNNNNGEGTLKFKLNVTVSSKGIDKVELAGFRYVNSGVYAQIKGNHMLISQVIEDSNERVEINGEGTLDGNTLSYSYVLKYKQKGKQERVYDNSATATRLE